MNSEKKNEFWYRGGINSQNMDKVFKQWNIDILSKVDVPYFILNRMDAHEMIYAYEYDLNAI